MKRKPSIRDLEQKLKAALLELKTYREMCDCLVGERDYQETEIRSVIIMNTKLKGELAELDVKCNDPSDQRDRLQGLGNETDRSVRAITASEVLQEELQNSRTRTHKLQHQLELSRKSGLHGLHPGNKTDDRCSPRRARPPEPRSGRVSSPHAAPADGQRVIMYNDEFGRSTGLQAHRLLYNN
ncbi:hypothetical protein EVAR_78393_1 [Eumeta japonica]|uniref:Uncharacterized protein n=1 Tax=Eumeta variegata TaxID=151549 RepID=A0A4C1T3H9_EUMVA|nr:hypothetical protein EVAR_78393_1 [Eumeta japonica]